MKLVRVLSGCLAAAAVAAGCGSNSASSHASSSISATTCGILPHTFTVAGRTIKTGSCAGLLPKHPVRVTVSTGEQFSVRIIGETGGKPAAPIPKPTGGAVAITHVNGRTVQYQAKAKGGSLLSVTSAQCPSEPKVSTCTVLAVTVR